MLLLHRHTLVILRDHSVFPLLPEDDPFYFQAMLVSPQALASALASSPFFRFFDLAWYPRLL